MEWKPTIYLGSDHGGWKFKNHLGSWLTKEGYTVEDVAPPFFDPADDYPFAAIAVALRVAQSAASGISALGILLCRSGAGMAIAANKIRGIRAVVAADEETAAHARSHNDANVLSLGADTLSVEEAKRIIRSFITTTRSIEPRHERRIHQIQRLEWRKLEVIPGIFASSAARVEQQVHLIPQSVSWVHIDLADGTFVPVNNLATIDTLWEIPERFKKEVHLMVHRPQRFVAQLAKMRVDRIIAHVEAKGIDAFLRNAGPKAALALNLATPIESLSPYVAGVDLLLVMCVKTGASGQRFDWNALPKIASLREQFPESPIEADGGMTDMTAPIVKAAGALRIVSTSYLFTHPEGVAAALQRLTTYA